MHMQYYQLLEMCILNRILIRFRMYTCRMDRLAAILEVEVTSLVLKIMRQRHKKL
jgi:hypothetical protein